MNIFFYIHRVEWDFKSYLDLICPTRQPNWQLSIMESLYGGIAQGSGAISTIESLGRLKTNRISDIL